mmetsp:Transcript_36302/g.36545  ORF Transcript_36302/g.36545 Transcript_36302/m.36545 type:complete len:130 (+) Transcript_36302:479-868(+)
MNQCICNYIFDELYFLYYSWQLFSHIILRTVLPIMPVLVTHTHTKTYLNHYESCMWRKKYPNTLKKYTNNKKGQLQPEKLVEAAKSVGQTITLNMREGFDHSYFFIAAFIDNHVKFHGERLNAKMASTK